MPVGWYIVPYERRQNEMATRYPAIDDYTRLIYANGGQWAGSEVRGNYCLVKIRARADILVTLDAVYFRLPKDNLADPLSDLSSGSNAALQQAIEDLGYSIQEITAALGDFTTVTLGDVLNFVASYRLTARWDPKTDEIILDGEAQTCRPVGEVDAEVSG